MLPGIDDGPRDLDQTLEMLRAAVESGIGTIAATPHLRADFPDVRAEELGERCQAVRDAIDREGIPIRLVPGGEVSFAWAAEASDERLLLASYDQRGTDLLVETPTTELVGMDRVLYDLRSRGYRVTLAHAERSRQFRGDDEALRALVEQGILVQVNADSLLGDRDGRTRRLARHLLTQGLAHAIASDGHRGTRWRPVTRLAEAVEAAASLVGRERAEWMASAAPRAIVEGAELPGPPARELHGRRKLFGRR